MDAHDGILRPADVVDEARDENHPLHKCFEWDDSIAGEAHRRWQARQLIRVVVDVIPNTDDKPVNVFVSLRPDRADGTGYRSIVNVMSDNNLRNQLLSDALDELRIFERKYRRLTELAPIFEGLDRVRTGSRKHRSKPASAGAVNAFA